MKREKKGGIDESTMTLGELISEWILSNAARDLRNGARGICFIAVP